MRAAESTLRIAWLACCLSICVAAQTPISDDFSGRELNPTLWSFVNPLGDASVVLNGTHALISVPSGTSHDLWTQGNNSGRLLQPVANSDFDVTAKFDSAVDLACQMQGLIAQQDEANYLRFDIYSSGTNAHLFVATYNNNSPALLTDQVIGEGISVPIYLRVIRQGNSFSYQTSADGQNFREAIHFTSPLPINAVGPFAGNNACGYTAPAFTASVDYFFNNVSPIVPQDGVPGLYPSINVWYGDNQTFGQNGIPQNWVNILGNVLSPNGFIQALQYSLNGGPAQPLWVGPDATRLTQPGDFNVELAYTELLPGPNSLVLTATDRLGFQSTQAVTINYIPGRAWPVPYSIDWVPGANIQDLVQVVDGKWEIQPDGTVRTREIGYDRLLALGDMSSWKNYVVTAETTVHYINDPNIPAPASHVENVFGVGILVGWHGHTHDTFGVPSAEQPGVGHPFPAVGWWSNSGGIGPYLSLYENTSSHHESVMSFQPSSALALQFETRYIFKMQVQEIPGIASSHYSFKAWPASEPEPPLWNVESDGDLSQGSVILGAHRTDVSFGHVTVTPLP